MTALDTARLRTLAEKAPFNRLQSRKGRAADIEIISPGDAVVWAMVWSQRDADLIVEALNNFPAIISRIEQLETALRLLLADVQDYPAWQRPCHAVDEARKALAGEPI